MDYIIYLFLLFELNFVKVENKPDEVHQDDIEKAIQYALTTVSYLDYWF